LIEKKIPGKGWEYIVYNGNDQTVLTQDAVQRAVGKWSYMKYDAFGRMTSTGIYTNTALTSQLLAQNAVNSHPLVNGVRPLWEDRIQVANYTNKAFPTAGTIEYTVNYYDDYTFNGATNAALLPSGITRSQRTNALLTGARVSKDDGTAPLLTVNYYDDRARLIQAVSQNHLGGTDRVTNTYSFVGELLTSRHEHKASPTGAATTVLTTNAYDHVGRLLTSRHKINSQTEVVLAKNEYNEIGQLKSRSLHSENNGSTFLSSVAYSYNERGWTTKAVAPQFSYQLNYDAGTNPQYNGNISQQLWGHASTTTNTFSYTYDKLNRLINGTSTGVVMSEVLSYDDMGNIESLQRDNKTPIAYSYLISGQKSNRLQSLSGGFTGTYTYDANGNATKDRTGMTFSYNYLNLPKTAVRTGVNVSYLYDALGNKLRKTATENSIVSISEYIGSIEYSKVGSGTLAIDRIATSEGYLTPSGSSYIYHYNLKDHLGNVRSVLKKVASASVPEIVQQSDYYPFGKRHGNAAYVHNDNRYLYNGKELQDELRGGVHSFGSSYVQEGHYDYGARFYDAEIGRWNVPDPISDLRSNISPYAYCVNNPLLYIDPFGLDSANAMIYLKEVLVKGTKSAAVLSPLFQPMDKTLKIFNDWTSQKKDKYPAENFTDLAYNATRRNAQTSVVKGDLLNRVKKDPAFKAWRKQIIAQYKLNPLIKSRVQPFKLGGNKFFSLEGDLELKLSIRGAVINANFVESNGTTTINYSIVDTFDIRQQEGRGGVYNGINGILEPVWVDFFHGNQDMKVEVRWNETITK
ncbi:RHS repeat-associated core domain-containing protein, partial [Sphingobacterium alkalisoli]